jgi:hypothetical protein
MSASVWFSVTDTDSDHYAMLCNTNSGTVNRGYYFATGGVGGGVLIRAYNSSGGYAEVDTQPDWTVTSANTWYHAVFIADGTNLTVYVNGVQQKQASFANNISYGSDATFIIGGRDAANYGCMNGILDEIAIWNRVLTADEITELYNNGAGKAYPF